MSIAGHRIREPVVKLIADFETIDSGVLIRKDSGTDLDTFALKNALRLEDMIIWYVHCGRPRA
jgi:hypothetical protein